MQGAAVKTIPSAEKAEWHGKVKSVSPSTHFDKLSGVSSGLILKATNSKAVCSEVAVNAGTEALEVEDA